MTDTPTFVTHLECSMTGKTYPADTVQGLSEAGRPLLVRYDLDALAKAVTKEDIAKRTDGFYRYREFLP
ncbi:MAG TPA: threonine synthase, partial [Rhodospirillaceae bacterium]|nr:threonine synthase [Rhodospirillaceae bacterium]